jgi:putative transposase
VILREICENHLEEGTAMTAKPSIDPAEFLQEHLAQASPDLLRELMQGFVNTLLSADADSVCNAA